MHELKLRVPRTAVTLRDANQFPTRRYHTHHRNHTTCPTKRAHAVPLDCINHNVLDPRTRIRNIANRDGAIHDHCVRVSLKWDSYSNIRSYIEHVLRSMGAGFNCIICRTTNTTPQRRGRLVTSGKFEHIGKCDGAIHDTWQQRRACVHAYRMGCASGAHNIMGRDIYHTRHDDDDRAIVHRVIWRVVVTSPRTRDLI